jgi:hypothetical protein
MRSRLWVLLIEVDEGKQVKKMIMFRMKEDEGRRETEEDKDEEGDKDG